MEPKPSEGMELRISGVNLGFKNPSDNIEEEGENIEGVIKDVPSNV